VYVSWSSSSIYGGDSGNRIFVLYWRCSLIRVSVIRGSTIIWFLKYWTLPTEESLVLCLLKVVSPTTRLCVEAFVMSLCIALLCFAYLLGRSLFSGAFLTKLRRKAPLGLGSDFFMKQLRSSCTNFMKFSNSEF
jgi:hypothetical protein